MVRKFTTYEHKKQMDQVPHCGAQLSYLRARDIFGSKRTHKTNGSNLSLIRWFLKILSQSLFEWRHQWYGVAKVTSEVKVQSDVMNLVHMINYLGTHDELTWNTCRVCMEKRRGPALILLGIHLLTMVKVKLRTKVTYGPNLSLIQWFLKILSQSLFGWRHQWHGVAKVTSEVKVQSDVMNLVHMINYLETYDISA